jgi:CRP-like cAMP-binding protein
MFLPVIAAIPSFVQICTKVYYALECDSDNLLLGSAIMLAKEETGRVVENRLLASLLPEERERLLTQMEHVRLPLGQTIIAPEDSIPYVYFPTGALLSLVSLMEDGRSVEAGVIGCEGMAGLPVVLGGGTTPMRSVVQIEGGAYRLQADAAKAEFDRGGAVQKALHRYMHALLIAFSQSAACNRLHPVEGRLARWLLIAGDGVQADTLPLTHEYLAVMLGMRRAGVTEACVLLRDQGCIDYHRGIIQITNREGLESVACECYAIVKKEFDRVLVTH